MNITLSNCCGCGACAAACPVQAIQLNKVPGGYVYPEIDKAVCVECGHCDGVCACQKDLFQPELAAAYVAVARDVNLMESASGGLFASLAQGVILQGGAVFGCVLVREEGMLLARHICAEDFQTLLAMKGSKYVQSDLGDSYVRVKELLEAGKTVLFTGTPCQIAGLKGFLQKGWSNLYTAEVICHGVPSQELFQAYLAHVEHEKRAKVLSFRFRDKSEGWKLRGSMVLERDGRQWEESFEPEESSYYQLFLNGVTYRENCYTCPYASPSRQGDVTLGDFWCVDLVHPELLPELEETAGVSCLVVNSHRGRKLMENFGQGIALWHSNYERAARYNAQLVRPVSRPQERQRVLALYTTGGYAAVEDWYQKRLRKIRRKRRLIALVPKPLKDLFRPIRNRLKP